MRINTLGKIPDDATDLYMIRSEHHSGNYMLFQIEPLELSAVIEHMTKVWDRYVTRDTLTWSGMEYDEWIGPDGDAMSIERNQI